MTPFDQVDLSRLPAPDIVETLDFEAINAGLTADFAARFDGFDALVESDPAIKQIELTSYLSMILRQRVNDAARSVMLPTATGGDLDNLVALFGIARHVVTPGDPAARPPLPAVMEADDALRRRAQLALEAATAAGTMGRYLFYALGAAGDVADASVTSPQPGQVLVSLISASEADWTAPAALQADVLAVVGNDEIRSLGDQVSVASATIIDYVITASLTMLPGAGAELAETVARANIDALIADRRLGRDITRSALIAALHVEGVHSVNLVAPAADVVIAATEAARCTGVGITIGGVDE